MSQLIKMELPNGQIIPVTVEEPEGATDTGFTNEILERLEGFQETVQAIATNVLSALASVRPEEVSVEFGLELAAGKTGIVAALVGGSGKAAFKITLKWTGSSSDSTNPSSSEEQK